jgi:hypothetical protein
VGYRVVDEQEGYRYRRLALLMMVKMLPLQHGAAFDSWVCP